MANVARMIDGWSSWIQMKNPRENVMRVNNRGRICSVSASATNVSDPYKTLRIHHNASKSDIKKAFRKLALQYHPDVCRENNNGVQFYRINEAYDTVMSQLRKESVKQEMNAHEPYNEGMEKVVMGVDDPNREMWEEWMGWEGAGIWDYWSRINPYI